jgi:hypothetical protein
MLPRLIAVSVEDARLYKVAALPPIMILFPTPPDAAMKPLPVTVAVEARVPLEDPVTGPLTGIIPVTVGGKDPFLYK